MKVWTKIRLKDQDKNVNLISHSFANYLFKHGPMAKIKKKYNITEAEMETLYRYTTNRIAGLMLLTASKDIKRINDIANRYNDNNLGAVIPEIECYIEK